MLAHTAPRPQAGRAAACACCLVVAIAACERPPVTPPDNPAEGALDLPAFVQDRPVIGGKWYDYDPAAHGLQPKAHAWIARFNDGAGGIAHAAFRIASYYDAQTADTGLFTLETRLHDGVEWRPLNSVVAPRNVKVGPAICLSLLDDDEVDGDEADCAGAQWHLQLALHNRLSTSAGFAVAEGAVFLAPGVLAARLDERSSLDDLPDPASLSVLEDGPASDATTSDWDFSRLAPDLPELGQAIGRRVTDTYFLVNARLDLVRFRAEIIDDIARVHFATLTVDRDNWAVDPEFPSDSTADIPLPAVGAPAFLSFATDSLLTPADKLVDVDWPTARPAAADYDVVLLRLPFEESVANLPGELRLLLSPAAAVRNATALGLDEDKPPTTP